MDAGLSTPLSAAVLGQLLLMQSAVGTLPDEPAIFSFVCRGLRDLPGVADVSHAAAGGEPAAPPWVRFPLRAGQSEWGELLLNVSDPAAFAPYEAYLKNFCFTLTVILEERHQHRLIEQHRAELEQRVQERTRELAEEIAERKRVEKALLESGDQFRMLFDQAIDGMLLADVETRRFTLANRQIQRMLGYREDELLQLTVADLHPSADLPTVIEQFGKLARGEITVAREIPVRRKDGTVFYADIGSSTVRLERRDCLLGIFRDVTEHKQAQAALRESEQRYRTIMEQAADAVFMHDETGRILDANRRACQSLGYTREELLSMSIGEIDPEAIQSGKHESWGRILAGESFTFESHQRRKDGSALPVEVTLGPVQLPSGTAVMGIVRDITQRQRAAEALRESEERFREQAALLDAANDAIYVRALDQTVTYWNAGAERLYGWSRAEALGRKITELGDQDPAAFAAAHVVLLERGNWSGELKKTSKEGQERLVFCRWTLLRDGLGRPKDVLAINTDITERKQLEAQYLRAQRMEGIGSLAGGIAHDLNNILTPILMTAPLLRETVGDPECREMLNTVEACAQRGADIIRQLLTFARGRPGVRVPLPVRHLLREMDTIIRETFPRNIRLSVAVRAELWSVLGDATQIHQALMNLCLNARDAMPEGGTLTLAAENLALDETFAALAFDAKPGAYVCLSVSDTGTGIPREDLDRIFDPFFTTKEVGKGTGLGLPTVLGIVRGHGGFVRVDSRVGLGTRFELCLPASPEGKAAAAPDLEVVLPHGHGELILVVDDEEAVRAVVQRMLEKHGYRAVVAEEGEEALRLVNQHGQEIRAVIADMMMPGMDGPALVRALRQGAPRLPILGMTGLADQGGFKGLKDLELGPWLTKPFPIRALVDALHQALSIEVPGTG